MRAVLDIVIIVLDLYVWLLIASAILSWLVAFNVVNTRNQFVSAVAEFLYRITEPVLLLDEPTEGIQPSIIKDMARTLKRIRDERGLSIVVSEQVLSFALDIADRVLVIENGEIVRDDPRAGVDAAQISKYLSV